MPKHMQVPVPAPLTVAGFRAALARQPGLALRFRLPNGSLTAAHAHLTEVARVEKRLVDCGGAVRVRVSARLQVWSADDTDHRVGCAKALQVLARGEHLLESAELPLEVEHDFPFLTAFPALGCRVEPEGLVVLLGPAKADCLAPEACLPAACRPGAGCC